MLLVFSFLLSVAFFGSQLTPGELPLLPLRILFFGILALCSFGRFAFSSR